ncbi:MAG: 3'-5' exonuclease [Sulfurospirillaceae bacterium]|nr:3'-5' exonuclease [Sulfurospirillaceae bacterium]MDD3462816.1 3'-5' exonuclease [Sulfurospirillaceae bacterium]
MFSNFFRQQNQKRLKNQKFAFLFEMPPEDEVVVLDTETTGLNPKKDDIISIGAIKIKGNKIITSEKFEVFIKPKKDISEDSIKIHQIRNIDIQNGIEVKDAIEQFLEFIGPRTLVGYYLEFDIGMINKYLKPHLGIKLPNKQIEISGIYHDKKIKLIPDGVIDLRFNTIMETLGLPIFGKHDAINDAIMTAMMYVKLKNITKL